MVKVKYAAVVQPDLSLYLSLLYALWSRGWLLAVRDVHRSGFSEQSKREQQYLEGPGNMTTSSPELSEMADIFPSEGWPDNRPDQQTALRPHAQAHLLSSTENCKVELCPRQHDCYLSNSSNKQKPDKLVPLTDSLISGLALLNPRTTKMQYF